MSNAPPQKPACPMFTLHALERWIERFGGNIVLSFGEAQYAGRAKRKAQYWISREKRAAFIVQENTVITIVPASWAKAYLARHQSKRAAA